MSFKEGDKIKYGEAYGTITEVLDHRLSVTFNGVEGSYIFKPNGSYISLEGSPKLELVERAVKYVEKEMFVKLIDCRDNGFAAEFEHGLALYKTKEEVIKVADSLAGYIPVKVFVKEES